LLALKNFSLAENSSRIFFQIFFATKKKKNFWNKILFEFAKKKKKDRKNLVNLLQSTRKIQISQ